MHLESRFEAIAGICNRRESRNELDGLSITAVNCQLIRTVIWQWLFLLTGDFCWILGSQRVPDTALRGPVRVVSLSQLVRSKLNVVLSQLRLYSVQARLFLSAHAISARVLSARALLARVSSCSQLMPSQRVLSQRVLSQRVLSQRVLSQRVPS